MPKPIPPEGGAWPLLHLKSAQGGYGFFDPSYPEKTRQPTRNSAPTWMDPHLFLGQCLADPAVQKILQTTNPNASLLAKAMNRVFDSVYLPAVLRSYDALSPALAQWLAEHKSLVKTAGTAPKVNRKKKVGYCWVCRACGERCGVHFFPVTTCRHCGGGDILQQESRSPLAYIVEE